MYIYIYLCDYFSGLSYIYIFILVYIYIYTVMINHIHIPDAPWCWNVYLQNWAIVCVNVGKYSIHGAFGYIYIMLDNISVYIYIYTRLIV